MRRPKRIGVRLAAPAAGVVVLVAVAAGLTVSHFEEQDPFCVSCHTLPEVTYYQRAQQARAAIVPVEDLSSAHYGNDNGFRCIDCHRGDAGLVPRPTALTLGARDTAIWLAGQADPAIEKTARIVPSL